MTLEKGDPDNLPLFREEAVAGQKTQWLGTVLLVPRRSHVIFGTFAVLATGAVLALLWFGHYTRKEHMAGWLVPQEGLVQVFAPQSGVVTELKVREGSVVQAGDPLVVLSTELQSSARGATQTAISRILGDRRASLVAERERRELLKNQQVRALGARIVALRTELAQLDRDIGLQRSLVALAEQTEARARGLRAQGFETLEAVQTAEAHHLEENAKLGSLQRSKLALERDSLTVHSDLEQRPLSAETEIAGIARDIGAVEQQLSEAESRREIVVPAPTSGTVTTILAERGGRPNAEVPLLSIVPTGSKLEAHMFAASSGIGFLRPGQRVLLRFQAYPYQKFGHHEGVLASISGSAVNPREMPAQIAGLTSVLGTGVQVYRLIVSLAEQGIEVNGRLIPLQPGMQLDADVLIERRRLIEWVFEPLFNLTSKTGG